METETDETTCADCGHGEEAHNSAVANGCCRGEWERCGCREFQPRTANPSAPPLGGNGG